jgi:diguanylate cyclase (GGDEF)-like protein
VNGLTKIFRALGVAFKNGAVSFQHYLEHDIDPLTRDALTLVFNRPQFERRRKKLDTYSLILIDIDDFKHINDSFGHSAGDAVLKAVAAVLRTSSGDRVFRVGGEEFAVLLAGCDAADAVKVAERLCATVRALQVLEGRPVTVSAGVAWSGKPATDHEIVYRCADQALYRAKCSGKNRVARYEALPPLAPSTAHAAPHVPVSEALPAGVDLPQDAPVLV